MNLEQTPKELAITCAKILENNKARDIIILHVTDCIAVTDYFVICSGVTQNHLRALSNEIELNLEKSKIKCYGIEGYAEGKWILMDYGDVIVHIYEEEARHYYELEDLWDDAPRESF